MSFLTFFQRPPKPDNSRFIAISIASAGALVLIVSAGPCALTDWKFVI
jgi:hypothetical protein